MKNDIIQAAGQCPECGSEKLFYGNQHLGEEAEISYYNVVCLNCLCQFMEYYKLRYYQSIILIKGKEQPK